MLQSGQNYYNEEQTSTTFNTPEATKAFETWTDFYTKYKFEQTYDAFSRFRTGEYPIVIQPTHSTTSLLLQLLKSRAFGLHISSRHNERGRHNFTQANSGGGGAIIFQKVENKENAWKFLQWFTSTETQVDYGHSIEALFRTARKI